MTRARATLPIILLLAHAGAALAADDPLAVNHVAVSDRLHTAGQPNAAMLGTLAERGFDLVINLAPPSSRDAVAEEGKLVTEDGTAYVNIPVDWQKPTLEDFALFSAVMDGARDRKVLVHCQLNMRASAFTFLYRVVHERVPPEQAFEALRAVWVPRDQWAAFTADVLAKNAIDFELPASEQR
jgi:protein tyrosine phosphatase (PTP) superfamily phosphohydrolase (DUF442 family)